METFYGMKTRSLEWDLFPRMVVIETIGDGSCFFHAIAMAFCIPYREQVCDRITFIRRLRHELALELGKIQSSGLTHYEQLSRGQLKFFAQALPQYSLENMQRELVEGGPVDNVYNEFVSDQIDKDIYLLDVLNQDVYITGDDGDILHKGRDSIVILVSPGHYELVGLRNRNGGIDTLFSSEHQFIQAIRKRIDCRMKKKDIT
jgi:hypothetical protein